MCWKCGNSLSIEEIKNITRNSTCGICGADLHSCKNCIFYDVGAHYDCHETVDELVTDKERANFCDYFKAKQEFGGKSAESDKAKKARDAFASLFGN